MCKTKSESRFCRNKWHWLFSGQSTLICFHFFVPLRFLSFLIIFHFFAGVMTFFCSFALDLLLRGKLDFCGHDDFFSLHLILRRKWNIREDDDLFFASHLILREKLDICGCDDLFFALHLILRRKLDISIFLENMSFFQQIAIISFFVDS